MASEQARQWSWREGAVDLAQDYLELCVSISPADTLGEPLLVARVGPPVDRAFAVQWLVSSADGKHQDALAAASKDLDFYLVAKGEPDPWLYAKHHAGTTANLYSKVHWSFHSPFHSPLARLEDVGFRRCGSWRLESDEPVASLDAPASELGVLYAFVSGRQVLYVGKTNRPLRSRIRGYERPGPTQRTNRKVHELIRELLASQRPLDIFAFAAPAAIRQGTFELNLAAGLEDAIIRALLPTWNHVGK